MFDTIIAKNNKNQQRPNEIGNTNGFSDYKYYNRIALEPILQNSNERIDHLIL
ncbi:hypothetical protein [Bacillus sp. J14TS2]|uniref:hypothetical protein n=1 Tax=Bacillus sp. J14TS2 TaxID=2807188 RepID=UPI001BB3CFF4|nr:hypothetical protein [Bacillus sp. J14TS2]